MAEGWAEDVSAEDLAYMAGIVDGEGCITCSVYSQNHRVLNCRVIVVNTNEDMIRWIGAKFGAPIYQRPEVRNKGWKTTYWATFRSVASEKLLTALLPYLKAKRKQAEILLKLRATKPFNTSKGISDEVQALREGMVKELQHLNRRGAVKKLLN